MAEIVDRATLLDFGNAGAVPCQRRRAASDEDLAVAAIPTMVFIGPDGVIRIVHTGALPTAEIRSKVAELLKAEPEH